ncbi:tRNA (5-methylaminomethyl-2-thiouridine)(34)-methyltransferase MnmD [Chitinophaga pinensis]|uniref:MnmC-like methyltransferase domain-containing protein n=1 Tax=Chitinophaga pinensis (strain ATCC 43595 / DSM 2588 / LMG 13176 / NBRC 15968 / NCIMB 11800 / UQM 2034) TaxID=485918 RepID=A0A979GVF2_CHIPD|nr:tRNA (5-methylaminomethyl-2-thiouridine)(34)-methyltransferase MnmD [Chitinophaga pinensis]ACU61026.1 protein of unknown function DUF752 [Chitinophaga pinensis DSM 2588]
MERLLQITADGSHTIAVPDMHVTFHSILGAIQESVHVYINNGLHHLPADLHPIAILEMGFGTGLNALLTLREAITLQRSVYYQTIEQYPLTIKEASSLNYPEQLGEPTLQPFLQSLHESTWDQDVLLHPCFTLHKTHAPIQEAVFRQPFDLIYYDAFAPGAQPELWTETIFTKLFEQLKPGGILVTYCSKGDVKRALKAAGFGVEKKVSGPKRKREMVRAKKP